jgi:hypothetical protein
MVAVAHTNSSFKTAGIRMMRSVSLSDGVVAHEYRRSLRISVIVTFAV